MAILLYANVLPQLLPLTAFSTFYGILQRNPQSIAITGFLYQRFTAFYKYLIVQLPPPPPSREIAFDPKASTLRVASYLPRFFAPFLSAAHKDPKWHI